MAGYTEDWRGRYKGAALCVALPGSTRQVADIVRLCNDYATPYCRKAATPACAAARCRTRPAPARYRQPVAPAPDPPRGPGQQFDGSRSRLRAGHGAAGRGGTRPPVPHQPGRGRFVPDRRHHRHQRGRHRRAALRQYARQHPGPGGRAARRIDLERPDRLAQEQYGFRPEALVHRRRRHLGHRDRGRAEAAPPAQSPRHRLAGAHRSAGCARHPGPVPAAMRLAPVSLRNDRQQSAGHRHDPCARPQESTARRAPLACAGGAVGHRQRRGAAGGPATDPGTSLRTGIAARCRGGQQRQPARRALGSAP